MMKRTIVFFTALFLVICSAGGAFALDDDNPFKEKLAPFKIKSIRFNGFGGPHIAYLDDFDALNTNPSMFKDIKPQVAVLELSFSAIGDSFGMMDVINNMGTDSLSQFARNSGGKVPFGFDIMGPLSSGYIGKGFAGGLYNRTYADAKLIGTSLQANVAEDIWTAFGASFNMLNFGDHDIDWGFALKVFGRGQAGIKGTMLEMIKSMDSITDTTPFDFSLGGGMDLGVRYKYGDHFTAALTTDDIISPAYIRHYRLDDMRGDGSSGDGLMANHTADFYFWSITPRFNLGAAYKISPLKFLDLALMLDYYDLINIFTNDYTTRNPILNLRLGTEVGLFHFVYLRAGMNEMLPSLGLGLDLKIFQLDAAYYGRELSNEPGNMSTYAFDVGIRFRY